MIIKKINIVKITAKVFGNFNLLLKKEIIGLPINAITTEIAIYTKIDCTSYKKYSSKQTPISMAIAFNIPLVIVFDVKFLFFNFNNCSIWW